MGGVYFLANVFKSCKWWLKGENIFWIVYCVLYDIYSECCFNTSHVNEYHLYKISLKPIKRDVLQWKPTSFFKINFYRSIVALQCFVSFCCAAKWISYMCADILFILDFLPIQITTENWVQFPVLYTSFSLDKAYTFFKRSNDSIRNCKILSNFLLSAHESVLYIIMNTNLAFPGGSVIKESTYQCKRCRLDPWVGKLPWRTGWQPTSVFLPKESHQE